MNTALVLNLLASLLFFTRMLEPSLGKTIETIGVGKQSSRFYYQFSEYPKVFDRGVWHRKGATTVRAVGAYFCFAKRQDEPLTTSEKVLIGLGPTEEPEFSVEVMMNGQGCINTGPSNPLLFSYQYFDKRLPISLNFWFSDEAGNIARYPVIAQPWLEGDSFFVDAEIGGRVDYSTADPVLSFEDLSYSISAAAKSVLLTKELDRVEFERVRFQMEPSVLWSNENTLGNAQLQEEPLPISSIVRFTGVFASVLTKGHSDLDFSTEGDDFQIVNTFEVKAEVDSQGMLLVDFPIVYLWREIPLLEDEMALFLKADSFGVSSSLIRLDFDFLLSRHSQGEVSAVRSTSVETSEIESAILSAAQGYQYVKNLAFSDKLLPRQELVSVRKSMPRYAERSIEDWKQLNSTTVEVGNVFAPEVIEKLFMQGSKSMDLALPENLQEELCSSVIAHAGEGGSFRKQFKSCLKHPEKYVEVEFYRFLKKLHPDYVYLGEGMMDEIEVISSYFHEQGSRNVQSLSNKTLKGWAFDTSAQEAKFSAGISILGNGGDAAISSKFIPVYFKGESTFDIADNFQQGERFRTKVETNTKVGVERSSFLIAGDSDTCLRIKFLGNKFEEKSESKTERILICKAAKIENYALDYFYISDNRHSAIEPERFKRHERAFISMLRGDYQYRTFKKAVKSKTAEFIALSGEQMTSLGIISEQQDRYMQPGIFPALLDFKVLNFQKKSARDLLCERKPQPKDMLSEAPSADLPLWAKAMNAFQKKIKSQLPVPLDASCQ